MASIKKINLSFGLTCYFILEGLMGILMLFWMGFLSFLGYIFLMILVGILVGSFIAAPKLRKATTVKGQMEGMMYLFASVLFVIPGVVSDVLAVIFLLAPSIAAFFLGTRFGVDFASKSAQKQREKKDDGVLDVEYYETKESKK